MSRAQGHHGTKVRSAKSNRLLASIAALAMVGGAAFASTSPAFAADPPAGTEPVTFADNQLLACVNEKLGGGRAPSDPVSYDTLNTIFGLSCSSQFAVSSLDGIEHAQKITNLFFAGGKHDFSQAGSLAAAAKMPKLNSLTLTDAKVSNASFADIGNIEGLTTLSLTGSPELTDITPLSSLEKLSKLDLSKNVTLSDLSPLSGSTKLRDFTASQNPLLVDLSPLSGLTTLTSVSVYKTAVESLEPLSELTELTNLSAGYTEVSSLKPLEKLTKMRNLSFDYAKLTSLDGIEKMDDLRTLDIHNNSGIGDNIQALENKTALTRLHMNAIGATSLEPLHGLTSLTNLQALGNAVSSLVGLQKAPATASNGTFAITSQQITDNQVYVPIGAKTFKYNAQGQLANRDGKFPALGGNLTPEVIDETRPVLNIEVIKAWPELKYTFLENIAANDRFSGSVEMPIVWSTITSDDSATIPLGTAWNHEVTFTDGFPMAQVTLSGDAPSWLSVNGNTLTGTPESTGDWTFTIEVSDALGNTMSQRFDLTVPKPENSYFEISEDQTVMADGDQEVTFLVSRTDATTNPYTGEASVRVRTIEGSAKADTHYKVIDDVITWDARETDAKPVTVYVFGGAAGGDDVALTVELSEPTPADHTELGGGFTTDLTITYPQPEPSVFSISKPQLVSAAAIQPGHQPGDGEQDVTFTVTRTDSAVHPWTGATSVSVKIYDPMASDGGSYADLVPLTWQAGDPESQPVTITVKPGNAGDPKRVLALQVVEADQFDPYAKPSRIPFSALAITYPEPAPTVLAIGDDQHGKAGEVLSFTVSRTDATVDPWTGEASVRVQTEDGSATTDTYYTAVDEVLVWAAGDTRDKTVEVTSKKLKSDLAERTFTLTLSDPSKYSTLEERVAATGTLSYEGNGGSGTTPGGGLANTGSNPSSWLVPLGAALLAIIAGMSLVLIRRRH